MTICPSCRNPCCDCSCPGCFCRILIGPNGVQCCSMSITGLQRVHDTQQQLPTVSPIGYMDQIMKQRFEAEQQNRFNK